MKTISIRELHDKTGAWIRRAGDHGEIQVTDRGRTIAKILPEAGPRAIPYFSRRKILPAFRKLKEQGKLRGGTDSTEIVSQERDGRNS